MSSIGKLISRYDGDSSFGGVLRTFIVSDRHFIIEHTREIYSDNPDLNIEIDNNRYNVKFYNTLKEDFWNSTNLNVFTLVWDFGINLNPDDQFWKLGNIFVMNNQYYIVGARTKGLEDAEVVELTLKNNSDRVCVFYYQNLNGEIEGNPYNVSSTPPPNNRLYQTGIYNIPANGVVKTLLLNTIRNYVPDEVKNDFKYVYPAIFTFSKKTPALTIEIKYLRKRDLRNYSMY